MGYSKAAASYTGLKRDQFDIAISTSHVCNFLDKNAELASGVACVFEPCQLTKRGFRLKKFN